jgi:sterol desaturase/sphingolipid hydroxylase (fatty acid hydroxylase superfamily)
MAMARFVTKSDETVALFRNRWLDALTHVHPATPVVVYLPVIAVFATLAFRETGWPEALAGLAGGALFWTLVEYVVHRLIFHYQPRSAWGKWLAYLLHGAHHDYPMDSTRLVTPLSASVPLAILFFLLFRLVVAPYHLAVFTGFVAAYLAYDVIHYAIHHWPMRSRLARWLKRHHLRHHFADPETGFGVSSPLWDCVFGTLAPVSIREEVPEGEPSASVPR